MSRERVLVYGAFGLVASAVFFLTMSIHDDASNVNVAATKLRGESLCERANSDTAEVQVNVIYRGTRVESYTSSTVRCADKATGEIVAKEFKSVLYREKT